MVFFCYLIFRCSFVPFPCLAVCLVFLLLLWFFILLGEGNKSSPSSSSPSSLASACSAACKLLGWSVELPVHTAEEENNRFSLFFLKIIYKIYPQKRLHVHIQHWQLIIYNLAWWYVFLFGYQIPIPQSNSIFKLESN